MLHKFDGGFCFHHASAMCPLLFELQFQCRHNTRALRASDSTGYIWLLLLLLLFNSSGWLLFVAMLSARWMTITRNQLKLYLSVRKKNDFLAMTIDHPKMYCANMFNTFNIFVWVVQIFVVVFFFSSSRFVVFGATVAVYGSVHLSFAFYLPFVSINAAFSYILLSCDFVWR